MTCCKLGSHLFLCSESSSSVSSEESRKSGRLTKMHRGRSREWVIQASTSERETWPADVVTKCTHCHKRGRLWAALRRYRETCMIVRGEVRGSYDVHCVFIQVLKSCIYRSSSICAMISSGRVQNDRGRVQGLGDALITRAPAVLCRFLSRLSSRHASPPSHFSRWPLSGF